MGRAGALRSVRVAPGASRSSGAERRVVEIAVVVADAGTAAGLHVPHRFRRAPHTVLGKQRVRRDADDIVDLLLALDVAVATDVQNTRTALAEQLADQRPPMASLGLLLETEKRDALTASVVLEQADCLHEPRFLEQLFIQRKPIRVVEALTSGPLAELVAQPHVRHARARQRLLELLPVVLRSPPRIRPRADGSDPLDVVLSQPLKHQLERMMAMSQPPHVQR